MLFVAAVTDPLFPKSTAYHEAGLVVVAGVLGMRPRAPSCIRIDGKGKGISHYDRRRPGDRREFDLQGEHTVLANFTGLIAQQEFHRSCSAWCADHDDNDSQALLRQMRLGPAEDLFTSGICSDYFRVADRSLRFRPQRLDPPQNLSIAIPDTPGNRTIHINQPVNESKKAAPQSVQEILPDIIDWFGKLEEACKDWSLRLSAKQATRMLDELKYGSVPMDSFGRDASVLCERIQDELSEIELLKMEGRSELYEALSAISCSYSSPCHAKGFEEELGQFLSRIPSGRITSRQTGSLRSVPEDHFGEARIFQIAALFEPPSVFSIARSRQYALV